MSKLLSSVPPDFQCPISFDLMTDPVTLSTGITYDRKNILKWLHTGHTTCPVTGKILPSHDLLPNILLLRLINEWCLSTLSLKNWDSFTPVLYHGTPHDKLTALLLLEDLCHDANSRVSLGAAKGLINGLINLLRPTESIAVVAAALDTLSRLCKEEENVKIAIHAGAVSSVLDYLHKARDSICERLLDLLNSLLGCSLGREAAEKHVAAIHIIVKKIMEVSKLTTEMALEALWMMCKHCEGSEAVCGEAIRCGALSKTLLVLQVPVTLSIKQKATEILKILRLFISKHNFPSLQHHTFVYNNNIGRNNNNNLLGIHQHMLLYNRKDNNNNDCNNNTNDNHSFSSSLSSTACRIPCMIFH